MTGPIQPRDHAISVDAAAKLTARHRERATAEGTRKVGDGELGGAFTKHAIIALLNQPQAAYLRYYHARDEQGEPHLVLVAVDEEGNDMTNGSAAVLDTHFPCPPICPPMASPLRG
jgi:hypothetical protein